MFPGIEDSTRLIHNLSESYSVEVKSWFDPMSADGKIKLIKAMIALRNNDGGRLVIGFDDATMAAVQEGRPESVRTTFGQDAVQALVTRYSSEAFEVQVQYVENGGADHPVICVPAGVRTPVATKGEVKDPDTQRVILPINTVYVRTLQSNNTVSTAAARWQDWDRICGLCFDNREADIGRFVRRHLDSAALPQLAELFANTATPIGPDASALSAQWLDIGLGVFNARLAARSITVPKVGYFELGAVIIGELKKGLASNQSMLNLIKSANRRFTGLPFFVTLDGANAQERPLLIEDGWERLFIDQTGALGFDIIDFWRVEPRKLYAIRAFHEDGRPETREQRILSFTAPIWCGGDALIEAVSIARSMVESPGASELAVTMRWTGLSGRRLSSAGSSRFFSAAGSATLDDVAVSTLTVPLDLPDSAIALRTGHALAPLYRKFQGFEMPQKVVDEEIAQLLSRTY